MFGKIPTIKIARYISSQLNKPRYYEHNSFPQIVKYNKKKNENNFNNKVEWSK